MGEVPTPEGLINKPITRREMILGGLAIGGSIVTNRLHNGIAWKEQEERVLEQFDARQRLQDNPAALVNDPSDPNQIYFRQILTTTHRTNTPEEIELAFKMGVEVFDIDANDVKGKGVFAEHGFVAPFGLFVFDVDEGRFKLGGPKYKFRDIVSQISEFSTPDNKLSARIELKRGPFEEDEFGNMVEDLAEFELPYYIRPRSKKQVETARRITLMQPNAPVRLLLPYAA